MAKKSSGAMGILAILGLGVGGVAAYMLVKGQGGEPLHGALGDPLTCWDGSIIYQSIYDRNVHQWLPYQSEADCPVEPVDGSPDPTSAVTCDNNGDGIMDKAGPNNEAVVYTRVWDALNNKYITDPTAVCEYMDQTLSNPSNCPSGGVYYPLIYNRLSHSWLQYETLANCEVAPPSGCTDPTTASGTTDVCRYGTYQDCNNGVWTDTGVSCGGGLVPTSVVQTAPAQPAITVLQGTNITCTYQLLDDMGYPLPGKTMRIYIDNGSSSFAGPLITNSSGMVSWTFPMTWGTYQTWDFDARFAGDTTYAASKSPYLNVTVTTVPPVGCTDPIGNLNDEICDAGVNKICTTSGWALGGTACPPPTTYDFTVYTDGTTFYGTSTTYAFSTSGTAQAVISATTLKASQSWTMGHVPITVEIQAGSYPITGNVWLLSNIDVFGVGPSTVLYGTGAINIGAGVSNTSFGNLTLDGPAVVVDPTAVGINVHDITYPYIPPTYDLTVGASDFTVRDSIGNSVYVGTDFSDALSWACIQSPGKVVYLPAGTYSIPETFGIYIRDGTTLMGDGDATILNFTDRTVRWGGRLAVEGSNITLRDFRMVNGFAAFTARGVPCTNLRVTNVYASTGSMNDYAFAVQAKTNTTGGIGTWSDVEFNNVVADSVDGGGFWLTGDSSLNTLDNIRFVNCGAYACGQTYGTKVGFWLNRVATVSNLVLTGCEAMNNLGVGYQIGTEPVTGVIFNTCVGSGNVGYDYSISASNKPYVTMTNCTGTINP